MTKNLRAAILFQRARRPLLVMVMIWASCSARAQTVTPTVADLHGYNYRQNGVFIDMSIGELAITTLTASTHIITQGFLQPVSIEQPCATPDLTYYPNPVVNIITLGAIDCDVYVNYIETYDLFGKEVLMTRAENNMVDLSPIGVGVYILRAYAEGGKLIGTVKIIKVTV